jgi:hypothetical protein
MAIIDINIATPTLDEVTTSGNLTTNEIKFGTGVGILLDNTSRLREGTIDAQTGGSKGIAQICAVGYELKWEAGSLYVMDGNGTLIREVNHKFNIIPDANNDSTEGFYVGSRWILDNGDIYVCTDSTVDNAVWEKLNSLDELVPYTGATADVNLGNQDLYANKVWLYDAPNDGYGSIHLTDNDFHIEDAEGHKMLVIEDGFMQIHLSDAIQSNLYTTLLSETRDHYLPNASGTIALTSDIPTFTPMPFKQNVNVTHTGTTANTIVASYLITAGTFNANDFFRFVIQTSQTVNTNVKTLRVYANTSASLTGATLMATRLLTSASGTGLGRDLVFKNSLTSQDISSTTNNHGDNENNTNVFVTSLTIDFTVNQYFIVAVELTNSTDEVVLRSLRTNIFR